MSDHPPFANGAAATGPSLPPLYSTLDPLTAERHGKLRIRHNGFAFAAQASAIPLMVGEFSIAARTLPIVFGAQAPHMPVALTGLAPGHNFYVSEAGTWRSGAYVPAYLRRVPFLLVRAGAETNQLVLCIDTKASHLSETEGEPLFDAEGKATPLIEQTLQFARSVEDGIQQTRGFAEKMNQLGLLQPGVVEFPHHGKPLRVDGFFAVDRKALAALPAEVFMDLRDKGWLDPIYAHLLSIGGLPELARDLAPQG